MKSAPNFIIDAENFLGGVNMKEVVVLVGTGSIGQAIARRVGAGKHVVLGDLKLSAAQAAAEIFDGAGFETSTIAVDISSRRLETL